MPKANSTRCRGCSGALATTDTCAWLNADGVPVVDGPEKVFERADNEGGVMVWMSPGLFKYLVARQQQSEGGGTAEAGSGSGPGVIEGLSEGLLDLRLVDRFGRGASGGGRAEVPVFRDVVYGRVG